MVAVCAADGSMTDKQCADNTAAAQPHTDVDATIDLDVSGWLSAAPWDRFPTNQARTDIITMQTIHTFKSCLN